MKAEEIAQLIQDERFLNYCFQKNKEDIQYWECWLLEHPEHTDAIATLKKQLILTTTAAREKMKQEHFSELQAQMAASAKKGRNRLWWRISAAAAILLFSVSGYFMLHKQQQSQLAIQNKPIGNISPGGNRAILTLGSGKQVVLTDAANGAIAQQGNVAVNKTADGQLVYNDSKNARNSTAEQVTNTVTTPRGGQWFIILSDGTKVWLNAASSIHYPVAFTGNQRKVVITGEAYFEVVHNAAKPFRVEVGNILVEDIGTAFNINAYTDEPAIKTTLVNGSAKISGNNEARVLTAGQQAIASADAIQVKKVNTENVIGWKNGQILFENEDLGTIMRQASRWYDVNVTYQRTIPNRVFVGGIPRKSTLAEFLKILEYENVHCTFNGNTIIVKP
ncbi:FecR family protein [Parafilimonas sp.]|uniref:FecR family protein n=1 Tax=Parafilimonas sp. TaxID=1969739 RepID=UPI0039E5F70A